MASIQFNFTGLKVLSKGKPQDRTLRKLYMYTEERIKKLKKANVTVAWTTEDQRFKAVDINAMINSI